MSARRHNLPSHWVVTGWRISTGRRIDFHAFLPGGVTAHVWLDDKIKSWRWKIREDMNDRVAKHPPYRTARAAALACERSLRFQLRRTIRMLHG